MLYHSSTPEPAEKPRRWFQFHLSTAVVLMFVAAGLIWANAERTKFSLGEQICYFRGWPYTFDGNIQADVIHDFFRWNNVVWNIAIALLILGAVAFVCEWTARRKRHG